MKEHKLNSLERVRDIYLTPEPFTVDNNVVTPTFKIKRNIAKVYFKDVIEMMYNKDK